MGRMTGNDMERKAGRPERRQLAVSVAEAAKMLGIGRTMAYRCVRSGELPSVTLGGRILVPLSALERLVDSWEAGDGQAA